MRGKNIYPGNKLRYIERIYTLIITATAGGTNDCQVLHKPSPFTCLMLVATKTM